MTECFADNTPTTAATRWKRGLTTATLIFSGLFVFSYIFPHITALTEICFYAAIATALFAVVLDPQTFSFDTPLTLPLLCFTAWGAVDLLWSLDRGNGLHDLYAHWLKHLALYFVLVHFFSTKNRFLTIIYLLTSAAVFYGILCMMNTYSVNPHISAKIDPFVENPVNLSAALIAACTILMLYTLKDGSPRLWHTILKVIAMTLNTFVVIAMQSRGALIGFSLSVLFLAMRKIRYLLTAVFCIALLAGLSEGLLPGLSHKFDLHTITQDQRSGIFMTTARMIQDRPLTGIGFGNNSMGLIWKQYHSQIPKRFQYQGLTFDHPHNIFLDVTVRLGFIGLAFFLYIIVSFYRLGIQIAKHSDLFIRRWSYCLMAVFTGLLAAGLFDVTFGGKNTIFVFILFALLAILDRMAQSIGQEIFAERRFDCGRPYRFDLTFLKALSSQRVKYLSIFRRIFDNQLSV
jgi:hypothetical protein